MINPTRERKMYPTRHMRQVSQSKIFNPGQRIGDGQNVHGGGGPENTGASTERQSHPTSFYENRPSWSPIEQAQEYFGAAAPSTKPNLAGIPSNNFRGLGDIHGARQ